MATRRRSSATKTVKPAPVTQESTATVKKVTRSKTRRVNKVTPIAKRIVTETPVTPVTPVTTEVKAEPKTAPDFTKLRGFDLIVLPFIYLEAFVVNFLQNLDIKVPERVTIK